MRTVADQLLDMVGVFIVFGHRHDDVAVRDMDMRHSLAREGQMHLVAIGCYLLASRRYLREIVA